MPEVPAAELPSIILGLLSSVNRFENMEKSLIRITADGDIENDEIPELLEIQQTLEQLSIMIEESIAGGIAYRIFNDGAVAGGMVLRIEGSHGELELLFVDPKVHSKGIGYAAWCAVEEMYPEVEIWETRTPDSTNICGETNLQLNVLNIFAFRIVGTPMAVLCNLLHRAVGTK